MGERDGCIQHDVSPFLGFCSDFLACEGVIAELPEIDAIKGFVRHCMTFLASVTELSVAKECDIEAMSFDTLAKQLQHVHSLDVQSDNNVPPGVGSVDNVGRWQSIMTSIATSIKAAGRLQKLMGRAEALLADDLRVVTDFGMRLHELTGLQEEEEAQIQKALLSLASSAKKLADHKLKPPGN